MLFDYVGTCTFSTKHHQGMVSGISELFGGKHSSNYFSTWKLMTYMKSHKAPEIGSGVIE